MTHVRYVSFAPLLNYIKEVKKRQVDTAGYRTAEKDLHCPQVVNGVITDQCVADEPHRSEA